MQEFKKLLLLGVILRILVMPFLMHPDIRVFHSQAQFFKSGVFDIYEYLEANRDELYFKEEFVYFPVAYLFLGSYQAVVDPLMGVEFDSWLNGVDSLYLYRYLFFLKLPYLFLDIAIAYILLKIVDRKDQRSVLTFWLFNPFTILLIYAYGNIDILPVFFSVLALYFLKINKGLLAGLSLVLGAAVKAYPLLLIPALLLTGEKINTKLRNIIVALVAFIFIIFPFWSESFVTSAFSSGLTNRLFEFGIDIGHTRKLPYYFILYAIFFIYQLISNKKDHLLFFFSVTLLLVGLVDYHIQWTLWFVPFMVILAVLRKQLFFLFLALIVVAFIPPLIISDKFMSVALYTPVSSIFTQASSPYLFLANIIDPVLVQRTIKSIFVLLGIFIIIKSSKYETISN